MCAHVFDCRLQRRSRRAQPAQPLPNAHPPACHSCLCSSCWRRWGPPETRASTVSGPASYQFMSAVHRPAIDATSGLRGTSEQQCLRGEFQSLALFCLAGCWGSRGHRMCAPRCPPPPHPPLNLSPAQSSLPPTATSRMWPSLGAWLAPLVRTAELATHCACWRCAGACCCSHRHWHSLLPFFCLWCACPAQFPHFH